MFPKIKKSTEIVLCGNKRFTIYHWSPSKVIGNMSKIGRLIAVPMGTLAGSYLQGGETLHEAVPTAILYVLDQMDTGGMEVINILLEGVEVNGMGGPIDIDQVFEDNVPDLMILLQTVVEINYGCFFGQSGFGALLGLFKKMGMVTTVGNLEDQDPPKED